MFSHAPTVHLLFEKPHIRIIPIHWPETVPNLYKGPTLSTVGISENVA